MLLVTGITGRSGQFFLQELIRQNYKGKIRCIVRKGSNTSFLDQSGLDIEKAAGDLMDSAFLDQALDGVDTVLHIASIYYSAGLMRSIVRHPEVQRTILVHTTGIYSKYKSAAAEYKHVEEEIDRIHDAATSAPGLVLLRPTMIYGSVYDNNMIHFVRWLDRHRIFPVINGGRSLLQPVHAKDLGRAYYQVLTNEQIRDGEYILSGSQAVSLIDLFRMISELLGKTTRFIPVPLCLGLAGAYPLRWITHGRIDIVEKLQRMGEDRNFSHEKATRDFGYAPMPLAIGLKEEIEEYQSIKG